DVRLERVVHHGRDWRTVAAVVARGGELVERDGRDGQRGPEHRVQAVVREGGAEAVAQEGAGALGGQVVGRGDQLAELRQEAYRGVELVAFLAQSATVDHACLWQHDGQ